MSSSELQNGLKTEAQVQNVQCDELVPKELGHESSEFPEGGPRAWFVAAGGSVIFFCTLGFANSFGTFEQYYLTHQLSDESPSKVSWIGSLAVFLQFFVGMFAGPLFDWYGARIVRPAALVYVVALMLLSLCKTYWEIILVQGVLMGITMGILQLPALAAVSQNFHKKRAGALALVVSGSSVGGIIFPIALSKMLNDTSLGFGWTIRVIGFIVLPLMIFVSIAVKGRLPPKRTELFSTAALKDTRFLILVAALFCMFTGMFSPFFYLPTYATTRGMSSLLAGYLLAILNAVSTFGRIIPGVLADKLGRINVFAFGGIVTGITIFCMNSVTTNAGLIVYAAFFGFTSGTIVSGGAAALTFCAKDAQYIGTYIGMGIAIAGLGSLLGPPVGGAMISHYEGFAQETYFSGAFCLFGGFLAILAKFHTPEGLFGRV